MHRSILAAIVCMTLAQAGPPQDGTSGASQDGSSETSQADASSNVQVGSESGSATQQADTIPRSQPSQQIQQGRYLVHHVAMCVQCHSPRDGRGRLDHQRLLTGGAIPVEPPFPQQDWATYAPRLAGLAGWHPSEIITLLQTGQRPNGWSPRPPMPNFHMTREDAEAVVAYLKSLR